MREKIKENNQRHKTINDSNTAIANNTHTKKKSNAAYEEK